MTSVDDMADDFQLPPPDKLALHHRRQLSAMLDGELSPDEAKFMLRRLQHDSELAACWERWQVCGDMLRGRGHALLPADFARRVANAIADGGQAAVAPVAMRSSRLARWGGSAALAASVAVVAFFVARQLPGEVAPAAPNAPTDLAVAASEPVDLPAAPAFEADPMQVSTLDQAATALAGAAAVAEVPRRASERRSRGQSQRAASRAHQRVAGQQAPVMVASGQRAATPSQPLATSSAFAVDSARADPFATQVVAPERPWPRAILPGMSPPGGGFAVGSGQVAGASVNAAFHPFEPRLRSLDSIDADADPEPAAVDEGTGEDSASAN